MKTLKSFFALLIVTSLLTSCSSDDVSPNSIANSITDDAKVSSSSLPAAILTYLATNYPGQTVTKAEKKATMYELVLSGGAKIKFTLDGTLIEVSGGSVTGTTKPSDNPQVALPAAITDYLAANYPGIAIYKAEKSATKYEVKLMNHIRVDFSLTGVVLRIRTW